VKLIFRGLIFCPQLMLTFFYDQCKIPGTLIRLTSFEGQKRFGDKARSG
jgi:hypothetical protein